MNRVKISGYNIKSSKKIFISGSKSESNRALILKSLFSSDITINNLSTSDDTKVLLEALASNDKIINIHHAYLNTSHVGLRKRLFDENNKSTLRTEKLNTRDPRAVERKKPGRKKARRSFQFSKR